MSGFKLELTFDDDANLEKVKYKGKSESEYKEYKKLELPMELSALEKIVPINLAYVHSSPGHWCIIAGELRWCPD